MLKKTKQKQLEFTNCTVEDQMISPPVKLYTEQGLLNFPLSVLSLLKTKNKNAQY